MPRIFDNIDQSFLPALRETIQIADRADFCVGHFNLREWKEPGSHIGKWAGGGRGTQVPHEPVAGSDDGE